MKQIILLIAILISHCSSLLAAPGRGTQVPIDSTLKIVWGPTIAFRPEENAQDPRIDTQGDTIHCVWSGPHPLMYTRSTDGGVTFSTPRNILTDSSRFLAYNIYPFIVKSDVFLIWREVTTTGSRDDIMWMMKSTDRGDSWGPPIAAYESLYTWFNPTVFNDTIVIGAGAYGHNLYRILSSTNAGTTWHLGNTGYISGWEAEFAVQRDRLHMVKQWRVTGVTDIESFYISSPDLGNTLSDSMLLTTPDTWASETPAIGADKDSFVIVGWNEGKYGCLGLSGCSIMFRRSTNGGKTFEEEQLLTEEPSGHIPHFLVKGSSVAAVWDVDSAWKENIALRYSPNFMETLTPTFQVNTDTINYSAGGIIDFTKSGFFVAWTTAEGEEVYRIYGRAGKFVTTGINPSQDSPMQFLLFQNHPNPFNPKTVIGYTLLTVSDVLLNVYNIFGQEVATLVNKREEVGEHRVEWNAERLPSGLYFYRLTANGKDKMYVQTRKMMLMK